MKLRHVMIFFLVCFASVGLAEVATYVSSQPWVGDQVSTESSMTPTSTEPTLTDWIMLLKSMGGAGGMGALGIAALMTQLLMFLLRTKLGEQAGAWRLAVAYGLSMVSGVIAMKMTGVDWVVALLHSNTLAALQVFGHQVIKQAEDLKKVEGKKK